MTNNTDKTTSRGEYLTMALQLADSYLKLYVTSYYVADIISIDSRYQRSHMWHPVAQADNLTSADIFDIAARQMAVLCYHHNYAQVMLRIAGRAKPVILTWHESEWHEGDILP